MLSSVIPAQALTMPPIELLIHALSAPESYPHPTETIRVVQTHVSCVFLAGDRVYKIKKPVRFPFLDYSTLERRRECCEQELRLNRRLCPELYLDLVPITEEDGAFRVDGRGEPCEWAVRMRRIPEEHMLPARIRAGKVSRWDVERIAETLARFHAEAETGKGITRFGTPERVAWNIEENFEPEAVRSFLAPDFREHLLDYFRTFLREQHSLFQARMDGFRVRDGHGDLRAQNIALWPELGDGLQIFDCIEFNDSFRYEDVAADLAYLAMDLDLLGRADLRSHLVARYAAAADDPDLLRMLRFFQCYRACVRGKIALLALAEPEIPEQDREEHLRTAAAAFDLALSYTTVRLQPMLWLTAGLSGTGKSRIARELARRLPAVRLSSDEIRKQLAGVRPNDPLGPAHYSDHARDAVYDALNREAAEWLPRGEDVILDATFLDASQRARAERMARRCGARIQVIECRAEDATVRQRLAARGGSAKEVSDAGLAVYRSQRERYGPSLRPDPGLAWKVVDTDCPAEDLANEIIRERVSCAEPASLERKAG